MQAYRLTRLSSIKQAVKNNLRLQQLVFSRWSQVMFRFEKSMYANPDQDLNKLWWDLVEKYQLLKNLKEETMPTGHRKFILPVIPVTIIITSLENCWPPNCRSI